MTKKWLMYAVTGLLCCGIVGFAVAAKQNASNKRAELERAKLEMTTPSVLKNGQSITQVELNAELGKLNAQEASNLSATAPEGYVAPVQKTISAPVQEMTYPNKDRIASALEQMNAGMELSYSDKLLLEEYWAAQATDVRDDRNGLDDQGGPSAFGYRWVDNLAGDTATYVWEEPTAPVELTTISSSDDAAETVPFGFNFTFYGNSYTSAFASTNGVLAFVSSYTSWSNPCPQMTFANPMILPYHDDGNTSTGASSDGGRVVYQQYADHVTITWDSVGTCCTNGTDLLDYQVQLWNNGKIKLQYRQIQAVVADANINGSSPLIGIHQATGLDFLNYHCSTVMDSTYTNALDGRAVWFYLGAGNLHDYRAVSVVSPALLVEPNASLNIVGRFTNFGSTTEASPVKYQFNGGALVTENTAVLAQFNSEDHDWAGTETAPGVVGDYELLMYSDLATDVDRTNDTLRVMVLVRECADETVTAPGTWTGNTAGAGDNCALRVGEDYVYEVIIPTTGSWTITLCGSTFDTYLYLNDACCGGTTLAFNDDSDCGAGFVLQSTISCFALNAGTYYVDVEPWSGGSGAYTLEVRECVTGACCYNNGTCGVFEEAICLGLGGIYQGDAVTCEETVCENPCVLDCGPDDIIEDVESDLCVNGGLDDPNGGCNLAVPAYLDIACNDTVCAQAYTCDATGNRDTDWFRFTLATTQNVTLTAESEFNNLLFGIVDITSCAGAFFISNSFVTDCQLGPVALTVDCLPPGDYVAFGAYGAFAGLPQNGGNNDYRMWLSCSPCNQTIGQCCYNNFNSCEDVTETNCINLGGFWNEFGSCANDPCVNPCALSCGPNDIQEAPEPDYCTSGGLTDPNGGCNVDPVSYTEVACGDTVCGEAFTCDAIGFRDTDWYRFTVSQAANVNISVLSESNTILYGIVDVTDCAGAFFIVNSFITDCQLGWQSVNAALVPGTYVAFVAPSVFAGMPEGGQYNSYRMAITGLCVAEPCDPVVDLSIVTETVGNDANNVKLYWTAPQDEDYKVWSTLNPNNDGDPNDGADADWTLEVTLNGLLAGPQSWTAPAGFVNYKNYVVTAVCSPFVAPVGRCCYPDFVTCEDITEEACNTVGGTWTAFQSCVNNPCPPPPPANDDCGNAVEVFNGTPLAGYTTGALVGTDITTCTFDDLYDVWYVYNAPNTNPITASLCEATFVYDTGISAWDVCGGTELACNDDFCTTNGLQSEITWTPAAAGPVYIRVSGYNSQTGNFTLTVTQ